MDERPTGGLIKRLAFAIGLCSVIFVWVGLNTIEKSPQDAFWLFVAAAIGFALAITGWRRG